MSVAHAIKAFNCMNIIFSVDTFELTSTMNADGRSNRKQKPKRRHERKKS